jgi:excisionase family DNA binding protein
MTELFRTLSLPEAASFLGIHKETARRLAACHEIPGAKIGRSCRFLEQDFVIYLRSHYSSVASQGVDHRSKKIWHSINAKDFGGSTCPTKVKEYEKALGLQ